MSELTPYQKGTVCQIAREAYDAWPGKAEYEKTFTGANAFTAWRHAEQLKAVGRNSLRHCTPDQYKRLCSHFIKLRTNALLDEKNQHLFQESHHEN